MTARIIMTVEEMQDRKKWLETRRTGIGGSDASVIAGLNQYRSLFSLWLDKSGQMEVNVEEEQSLETDADEKRYWGQYFEEGIAQWFTKKTGKKVRRCGMLRSEEYPFMIADVDRVVVGENAILECKTTASWHKDEWDDEQLPDSYYCQVQHYMAVGGYDKCYVVCLIGGQKPVIREVPRNDTEIKTLIEAEQKFWEEYVLPKRMPPADSTECCTKTIIKQFQGGDEEIRELDMSWDSIIKNMMELKADMKKLKELYTQKENQLRMEMENSELGISPSYKISYKSGFVRNTFDTKKFSVDYPDLYEQYKKVSSYRKLTIKANKPQK